MIATLRTALILFVVLTVLMGIAYPLLVTLAAQGLFPHQANGSVLEKGGKLIGSELIGQFFDDPKYFWSRPSATDPAPYTSFNKDPLSGSSGSNLGPTNEKQLKAVQERVEAMRKAHPEQEGPVPVDLVTASASGLDPHISPAAAEYQARRVAKARDMSLSEIRRLVSAHTEKRILGFLGEPRVNVLLLNLALDEVSGKQK
jgi:potassium-transporting ATPase KdpC subunit